LITTTRRELHDLKSALSRFETVISELQTNDPQAADNDYAMLVRRIRALSSVALPIESKVLVVSKGDHNLLNLNGRHAWHFPQTNDGLYAGAHPADSAEAISHFENMRDRGADYLLIPRTMFWWLEYYAEFKHHLDEHYRVMAYHEDICVIYGLRPLIARQ
jgi:hypothetical protein